MRHRRLWLVAAVLLACLLAAALPALGEEVRFETTKVPFGYLELPVPAGWKMLLINVGPGERQYLFTPLDLTLEQVMQGVDVPASLTIRVSRLETASQDWTAQRLLEWEVAYRVKVYQEKLAMKMMPETTAPLTLAGVDGQAVWIGTPKGRDFLFIGKRGRLLYTIDYQCDDEADQYRPLLERMTGGLKILDPKVDLPTRPLADPERTFTLTVPSEWTVCEQKSSGSYQALIARESVAGVKSPYKVGIAITRADRFSKRLKLPPGTDGDRLDYWVKAQFGTESANPSRVFDATRIRSNGGAAVRWERSYKPSDSSYYLQELHLAIVRDDVLYDVACTAPVDEFQLYYDLFFSLLKGFALND